ncbi:hypothetical protein M5689_011223 [Euphorbia peplus]|nr:hypothetical protein M5689_011223 [Euphorbia peplus]
MAHDRCRQELIMKKKIMIGHTICYSPTSTLLLEFWGRTAMEMKFNGLKLYLLFICSLASNTEPNDTVHSLVAAPTNESRKDVL